MTVSTLRTARRTLRAAAAALPGATLELDAGTLVATTRGEVPAAALAAGQRVLCRETGMSRVAAVRRFAAVRGRAVLVRTGALGAGLPEADMVLGAEVRVQLCGDLAESLFGAREVFVTAAQLTLLDGVEVLNAAPRETVEVVLESGATLLAGGAWIAAGEEAPAAGGLAALFPALAAV